MIIFLYSAFAKNKLFSIYWGRERRREQEKGREERAGKERGKDGKERKRKGVW